MPLVTRGGAVWTTKWPCQSYEIIRKTVNEYTEVTGVDVKMGVCKQEINKTIRCFNDAYWALNRSFKLLFKQFLWLF